MRAQKFLEEILPDLEMLMGPVKHIGAVKEEPILL